MSISRFRELVVTGIRSTMACCTSDDYSKLGLVAHYSGGGKEKIATQSSINAVLSDWF